MPIPPSSSEPQAGPNPDEIKAFFKAIRTNNTGAFQLFLNKYRKAATTVREPETGALPLMAAAKHGNLIMVEDLLYGSADINGCDVVGSTPLMLAALHNKFDIVRLLVDKGANLEMKTVTGYTALVFTTYDNAVESARILLAHGADTAALEDHHWTAMMRSLMNERLAVAETPGGAILPRSETEVRRRMALEFAKLKGTVGGVTGPANDSSAEKKPRPFNEILAAASSSTGKSST